MQSIGGDVRRRARDPLRRRRSGSSGSRATFLGALLALATPAHAQPLASVSISVDASAAGAPLERVWAFHGYDEINYTTVPEGEELLRAIVAAHAAPAHVRSHFLLNTGDGTPSMKWGSTNVYTEDANGNPVYSWQLTDGILDALTTAGALPFVELGFMPEALSTRPTPYQNSSSTTLDGGCFYPPYDYTKWAALIREWATHANERYPNVGDSWLWELWNEPDIGYWKGTVDEFNTLYDHTEAALHEVLPTAPLGGPAVAGASSLFLTQFLKHCATGTNAVTGSTGTRLDLVSFHAKGGVTLTDGHVQMNLGGQLRLHQAGMQAVARFPEFKQTPIYITEADPDGCAACPVSTHPEDAYRTSTAYGAYVLAMMKRSLELEAELGVDLRGVLTWAFTFPETPYFAGYRTLATNGIHLPVLGAFKLLGHLAGSRLPLTSSGAATLNALLANSVRGEPEVDGMATLDGNTVRILVWNYHDDLTSVAATPVHVTLTLPESFGEKVRVSHLRLDETHGDAHSVWVAQGMPESPSAEELVALRQAMDPSALAPDTTLAAAADRSVSLDFELPRFGASLLTLEPAGDSSGGGPSSGGAAATEPTPKSGGGGCSCRLAGRGDVAIRTTLLLGLGALVVVLILRGRRRPQALARRERKALRQASSQRLQASAATRQLS